MFSFWASLTARTGQRVICVAPEGTCCLVNLKQVFYVGAHCPFQNGHTCTCSRKRCCSCHLPTQFTREYPVPAWHQAKRADRGHHDCDRRHGRCRHRLRRCTNSLRQRWDATLTQETCHNVITIRVRIWYLVRGNFVCSTIVIVPIL